MRYLVLGEILDLYLRIIDQSGGASGTRDLGGVDSALAQPRMTFGGAELYPTVAEKTAALGYTPINDHPFVDGNRRTGHAAMEVFLILNGFEIDAPVDEQERVIPQVASGAMSREALAEWLPGHIVERNR